MWYNVITSRYTVAPLAGSVDRNLEVKTAYKDWFPSLPSRGAWIEIGSNYRPPRTQKSLPSRGAWIEMVRSVSGSPYHASVAPLAGSVDRNYIVSRQGPAALRVAPLAGSVDRNYFLPGGRPPQAGSLPSRGAWIEIISCQGGGRPRLGSLPSRGAWIEMRRGLFASARRVSRSPRGERG